MPQEPDINGDDQSEIRQLINEMTYLTPDQVEIAQEKAKKLYRLLEENPDLSLPTDNGFGKFTWRRVRDASDNLRVLIYFNGDLINPYES